MAEAPPPDGLVWSEMKLRNWCRTVGVTEDQLSDRSTFKFIRTFVLNEGGITTVNDGNETSSPSLSNGAEGHDSMQEGQLPWQRYRPMEIGETDTNTTRPLTRSRSVRGRIEYSLPTRASTQQSNPSTVDRRSVLESNDSDHQHNRHHHRLPRPVTFIEPTHLREVPEIGAAAMFPPREQASERFARSRNTPTSSQRGIQSRAPTRNSMLEFRGDVTTRACQSRNSMLEFRVDVTTRAGQSRSRTLDFRGDVTTRAGQSRSSMLDFRGDVTTRAGQTRSSRTMEFRGAETTGEGHTRSKTLEFRGAENTREGHNTERSKRKKRSQRSSDTRNQFSRLKSELDNKNQELLGLKDEVTCCICLEVWRNPKTLPCGHIMCNDCLAQVQNLSQFGACISVRCPECRNEHVIEADQWHNSWHTSRRLIALAEKMENIIICEKR